MVSVPNFVRSAQLPLEGSTVATAIFKSGIGVEVWKENELCGTVDDDRLRKFARARRPENLVAIVEAMLEHPSVKPATKKDSPSHHRAIVATKKPE